MMSRVAAQRLEEAIKTHNVRTFMECVYSSEFDPQRRDAGNKNRTWLHKAASVILPHVICVTAVSSLLRRAEPLVIYFALQVGSTFAAALLLEKSGDLLCKDSDGNTALELAIGGGHTDCALLLAKKMGVELSKRNVRLHTNQSC